MLFLFRMLLLSKNQDFVDIQDVAVVHNVVVQNAVVVQCCCWNTSLGNFKIKAPPPFTTKYLYAENLRVTSD